MHLFGIQQSANKSWTLQWNQLERSTFLLHCTHHKWIWWGEEKGMLLSGDRYVRLGRDQCIYTHEPLVLPHQVPNHDLWNPSSLRPCQKPQLFQATPRRNVHLHRRYSEAELRWSQGYICCTLVRWRWTRGFEKRSLDALKCCGNALHSTNKLLRYATLLWALPADSFFVQWGLVSSGEHSWFTQLVISSFMIECESDAKVVRNQSQNSHTTRKLKS